MKLFVADDVIMMTSLTACNVITAAAYTTAYNLNDDWRGGV